MLRNTTTRAKDNIRENNLKIDSVLDNKVLEDIQKATENILEYSEHNKGSESIEGIEHNSDKGMNLPTYILKHKYATQKNLALDPGTIVYVEKKNKNGWWTCIINNQRVLLPHNYLTEQ